MVSLQWKEDYLLWHWRPGALINLRKRHTHTHLCVWCCVLSGVSFFFFKPSVLPKGLDLAGIVGTFGNIVRSQHRAVMWWNLCPSSSNELLVFLPNSLFTLPRKQQVIVEEVLILLSLYFLKFFCHPGNLSPPSVGVSVAKYSPSPAVFLLLLRLLNHQERQTFRECPWNSHRGTASFSLYCFCWVFYFVFF